MNNFQFFLSFSVFVAFLCQNGQLGCSRYEEERSSLRESFVSRVGESGDEKGGTIVLNFVLPGRKEGGDGSGEKFFGEDVKGEV